MSLIDCYECSVYGLMCQQENEKKRTLLATHNDSEVAEILEPIIQCSVSDSLWEIQSYNILKLITEIQSPNKSWNREAKKATFELSGVIKAIQAETDPIRKAKAYEHLLVTVNRLTSEFGNIYAAPSPEYQSETFDFEGAQTAEDSVNAVKTVVQLPLFTSLFDRTKAIRVSENNDEYDQLGIDMLVPFSSQAKNFLHDENLFIQVKSRPIDVVHFLEEMSKKHARNNNYVNPYSRPLVVCCGQYGYKELAAQIGIQLWANSEVRNSKNMGSFLNILDPHLVLLMQRTLARTEMEHEMVGVLTSFYQAANEMGPRRVRKQSKRKTNDPKKKAYSLIEKINSSTIPEDVIINAENSSRFSVNLQ